MPERVGALARGLAAAVPVFLLIAGYAIWLLIAGPNRPAGPVHILSGLARYHADLLSPLFPTDRQLLAPGALKAAGDRLPAGGTIENGFYLGFPLLVLLCYFAIRYRRVPLVATATVIGLVAFVVGLGAKLTVAGKAVGIPLPFAVFTHLPILENLEPARLSLYVQLAAAVIVAVGLDRTRAYGWRRASAAAGRGQPSPAGSLVPAAVPATRERAMGSARCARAARARPGDMAAPGDPGSPGPGGQGPSGRAPGWVRPVVVAAVGLVALFPLVPKLPIHTYPVQHTALLHQYEGPRGAARSGSTHLSVRAGPAQRRHDVAGSLGHEVPRARR